MSEITNSSELKKDICWCVSCYTSFKKNGFSRCNDCTRKCTMCCCLTPFHEGSYKCFSCNCHYCEKHIETIRYYNGCPGCFSGPPCCLCVEVDEKPDWLEIREKAESIMDREQISFSEAINKVKIETDKEIITYDETKKIEK